MAKRSFLCSACAAVTAAWVGRCPSCGEWNTIAEREVPRATSNDARGRSGNDSPGPLVSAVTTLARRSTGLGELDRVLGGGLVEGSVTLVVGAPGSGKSTLMLQVCEHWAATGTVLLASGEESAEQVGDRAARLGVDTKNVLFLATRSAESVLAAVERERPDLVVVDSVQTLAINGATGLAGGVTQVRAVTEALVECAKTKGVAIVLIGHVTKDGDLAGPRTLEHLVDTVVSVDGDRHDVRRYLRVPKHRFGATGDLGVLDLHERGMADVVDPSLDLLTRRDLLLPGSSLTVTLDGSRPLLAEVQSLCVSRPDGGRVTVSGLDPRRVDMVLAVMARWCEMSFYGKDVFVSTAAGLATREPAVDLAIAVALASSEQRAATRATLAAVGEIGLGGDLRADASLARRVRELVRLGFSKILVPSHGDPGSFRKVEIVRCPTLADALSELGYLAQVSKRKEWRGAS